MIIETTCSICNAPTLNTICSNIECSSWDRFPDIVIGKSSENPITIRCPECNNIAVSTSADAAVGEAYCYEHQDFPYTYILNHWYQTYIGNPNKIYTIKYIGPSDYWDDDNKIVKVV